MSHSVFRYIVLRVTLLYRMRALAPQHQLPYNEVTTYMYVKVHVFRINSSCKESDICNQASGFSIAKVCFSCLGFIWFQFLLLLYRRVFLAFDYLSRTSFKRFLWHLDICSKASACILSCLLFQRLYIAKGRVMRCITGLVYSTVYLCMDTMLKVKQPN